jgi:hypothetical protein
MTNFAFYRKETKLKTDIEIKIFSVIKYRIENKLPLDTNTWDLDSAAHLRKIARYKTWRQEVY